MSEKTQNTDSGRLHRSPQYPSMSLRKAVDLARRFWNVHRKDRILADKAIIDIGYKPTGSSGQRALSALVSYGLLDSAGPKAKRTVWISDLGRRIVTTPDEDSPELIRDLQEAAVQPPVLNKLISKWFDALPLNDQTIKTILLRDMEFNPSAVDAVIDVLKDTYEYARFGRSGMLPVSSTVEEAEPERAPRHPIWKTDQKEQGQAQVHQMSASGSSLGGVQHFTFPLLSGGSIIINAPSNISRRDLERFYKWWDITSEALIVENRPEAPNDQTTDEEA